MPPKRGIALQSTLRPLVEAAERGDRSAADALFSALYSELHRVSKRELARQGGVVSLGATTLLHQAYRDRSQGWNVVPRPRQVHGVCFAGHVWPDY
jgi:hypothetical protein